MRGLLCFNCNGALGQFRERADLTLRAFAYLGREPGQSTADLPVFKFGVCHGGDTDVRPEGETWPESA